MIVVSLCSYFEPFKHSWTFFVLNNVNFSAGSWKCIYFCFKMLSNVTHDIECWLGSTADFIVFIKSIITKNVFFFIWFFNLISIIFRKMSDGEYESFEINDYDLENEFNPNRPRAKLSKHQQIYGKSDSMQQFPTHVPHIENFLKISS